MNSNLHTLKSKDGKLVVHGTIVGWVDGKNEWWFVPSGGSVSEPWWCNDLYWDIHWNLPIYKINKIIEEK